MPNIYGTNGNDVIIKYISGGWYGDIRALEGDDLVVFNNGGIMPGPGNDIIYSQRGYVNVIYSDSIGKVNVNLKTGIASDGYGNVDILHDVRAITGTRFDDEFQAGDKGSQYTPNGGSDVITGGLGFDHVTVYIKNAKEFIDFTKDESIVNGWKFNYEENSEKQTLYLSQIEELSIHVDGSNLYKKFNLLNNLEEIPIDANQYYLIPNDEFIGNFKFERLQNRHVKVTNLVTNVSTELSGNYIGIRSKNEKFDFHSTGLSGDAIPWFHTTFKDSKSNSEYLLLATLSNGVAENEASLNTSPSPVFVYGVDSGQTKDYTNYFFNSIPYTYWNRDIHVGDINGDGFDDIFFSNQGREVGSFREAPHPRVNPVWGEKNLLFWGSELGWKESNTNELPKSIDFSHGSSLADIDGDGTKEIIVHNLGFFDGYPNIYILKYQDGKFTQLNIQKFNQIDSTFTLAGDINKDGYDDVVAGSFVFWGGVNFGSNYSTLSITNDEKLGFINFHGGALADLNGDGYLDILKISASDGSPATGVGMWQGLKFSLYFYTKAGFIDSSSNFSAYNMDQFGINVSILDIDFDGHLDILTSGPRYFFGSHESDVNKFYFRNDGTGHFKLMEFNLFNAQNSVYFLKQNSNLINIISIETSGYVYPNSETLTPNSTNSIIGNFGAGSRFIPGFDSQFYINYYPDVVNLINSGAYSSALDHYLQKGKLENKHIYAPGTMVWGSDADESLVLREGNESAYLGDGNDQVSGLGGNDAIIGGDGIDFAVFSGALESFELSKIANGYSLRDKSGTEGTDTLTEVERLKFVDQSLAIDISGNAGTTAKILGAVFGKQSLSNKNFVGIGLYFLDSGWTYDNLAGLALDAAGAKTNDQIVSLLWTNVVGTTPTSADKSPFIAMLENGMSPGALAHLAADSAFNTSNINLVGLAETGIEFIPWG